MRFLHALRLVEMTRELGLGPVDEIELFRGSRKGRIEPVDIVGTEHIVRHIALIKIDVRPLSALCLMTGHGIGILYLKSVIIFIALQFFDAVGLKGHIGIILQHRLIELFLLLSRQGRCLRGQ